MTCGLVCLEVHLQHGTWSIFSTFYTKDIILHFTHQIALFCAWLLLILLWWFPYLLFCFMKPSWFLHCPFTLYFPMHLWLCILTDLWWIFQYCRICLSIFNTYGGFGVIFLQKSLKLDLWVCVRLLLRRVVLFVGHCKGVFLGKTQSIFFVKHLVYTE